jgi:hypothetical protein
MCCFSKPVISVTSTNIFARPAADGRQFLVYSMSIHADTDLAMILPLPVKQPAGEKDLTFIDLKGYPDFFRDMERGFPQPDKVSRHWSLLAPATASAGAKLEVQQVGDFEASFVPTVSDFSRLDERFRLPEGTWKDLPGYQNYGFAVFKLRPGVMRIHPMAFSFPRRDPHTLFFPTVHIHDGAVHPKAHFDHALYCQPSAEGHPKTTSWRESSGHPASFMMVKQTRDIVLPDQHCYKKEMRGEFANEDTLLKVLS